MNDVGTGGHQESLRQQTVLARFGELALKSDDLDHILTEACRLVGEALGTDLAKVMELQPDGRTLLVRAGVGWKPGVVGEATIELADDTSEGHALKTGKPMISPDIAKETRFRYPPFLTDHDVKAVANVVIIGAEGKPPFGILQIDSRAPRAFDDDDTAFLSGYANLLAAAVERLRGMEEGRDKEERLRLALDASELGSWELDLASGRATRSARHDQIFGYGDPPPAWTVDMFLAHILPEDREGVLGAFRHAMDTGTEWRFECRIRRAGDGEVRWIEARGRPLWGRADARPTHMLGIVADITARKTAEEVLRESDRRRAFLLQLGDGLRALSDPREVMAVAAELLGRHLGMDRAGYAEVTPDGQAFTVERDWCAPGMPSLAGRHRLDDFGPALIAEFRVGRTVAFDDALDEPLTAGDTAAAYRAASTRAAVTVPLIKGGHFAAAFYVHSRDARHWTDEDEALVREVAERTWAAVEQVHAEADLRASQARLGAALTIAQLGTFEWDLLTNAVTLDDRSRDIFGFGLGEGEHAQDVFDRIEPSDLCRVLAEAQASIRDRSRLDTEYRINLPDGTVRTVASISNVIAGANGEAERQFGVFADVTERKRTEARLRELNETLESQVEARTRELAGSEARFRAYFDASPENLFLLRVPPGCGVVFEDLNPAAEALCGAPRDAVVGHALVAVLDPETAADVERRARECLRLDQPLRYETPRRFQFGRELVLNVVAAPLPAPAGGDALVLFCKRDVTEQRQAEEALRQSQKMEAVGQLTGGLAHDFNNLLAGISGSLELLQTRIAQGRLGDLERYIAAAQGAAKRAAALTHRLLAFTRRQTLDPKPTDVNRLVADMEELVRRTVGPQVEVEVVGAAGLWTTLVDPNQLENALLNLCINARDAMPDGGRLTVETGNKWLDERTARSRGLAPGQYVSLCVSDTGTGMTPEVARRAFEPFFTTKPIGMGTGLGLSMIYGFVQQSGGQARIYSEPGQGAMVCLYLPRHHGKAEAGDEPAGRTAAPRAEAGETVLVVDDEPTVRMLVTEVLEDLGYTAIEAADGAAGLQVLRSDARIDLLVTDVGLPGGMNGRQVADAGRAVRPGLKVLFITGYAENAVLSHGHLDPGMHVLTKPFAMEALASRIRELTAADQAKPTG